MSDWVQAFDKVKPGLKAYLFVGTAGNAIDELIERATEGATNILTLRPPLTVSQLGTLMGMPEDSQVIVVREVENASAEDWTLLDNYLKPNKVKGRSLLLTGTHISEEAVPVRNRIIRQGVYIDVKDPGGDLGRKNLAAWLADECKVLVVDAAAICRSVEYSIESLVWVRRAYLAMTGGRVLSRSQSQRFLRAATPFTGVVDAFHAIMTKNKSVLELLDTFDYGQTSQLLSSLESALTDISLMAPYVAEHSPKVAADKSGLHIVRILELRDYVSLYPSKTVIQCRKALDLGFQNIYQPESAKTVALLWS